jgi:uncharacterized protein (TIGR02646 family)
MVRTRPRPRTPVALARNKRTWTARWKEIDAANTGRDWATQTAKRALKKPLLALTWGKCAFCEGLLGAQAYPQIEHYVSRKVDPDRAFEWRNLLPVCQVCNVSKGHEDHQGSLLKPDVEDPEPFFWIGPEGGIAPHPSLNAAQASRASETIRLCGLNRGELRENRHRVANCVRRWLQRTSVNGLDDHTLDEWVEISDPRQSHKIVVRHILTLGNSPQLAALDRELFQQGR